MLGSAPAIIYPLNKWFRAGKSNKRKEEKMDTSIDKPVKRPVPKPITGQFPKCGDNGQFLPGAVGNPKGRPRGSRNRASLLMDQTTHPQISQITQIKIQFRNLRNLRNLRMGSGSAGPGLSVFKSPRRLHPW